VAAAGRSADLKTLIRALRTGSPGLAQAGIEEKACVVKVNISLQFRALRLGPTIVGWSAIGIKVTGLTYSVFPVGIGLSLARRGSAGILGMPTLMGRSTQVVYLLSGSRKPAFRLANALARTNRLRGLGIMVPHGLAHAGTKP
jgi:hypothetical protein